MNEGFEAHRERLRAVAYRMLGSHSDAEDVVQEAWLRLARVDAGRIDNLGAWLTTVVSRLCLDTLRARENRREEPAGHDLPVAAHGGEPAEEAVLADSAGRALLVVLDRLSPAERVAFVLHDLFAVPFEEVAPVVGRTTATTKKLASRARQKVRGRPAAPGADLDRQRRVVAAFLAAVRAGDVEAVLRVLDPDVVRSADGRALAPGRPAEVRGASRVAEEIAVFGRSARWADLALVDGAVGIVIAPRGRLRLVLTFTIGGERITGYRLIADPGRLAQLELALAG
ncbi:sigma-70 family RNA polymerase sigma factor [Amycolatopsis viridis]|uniref:RNA polymerase sigma-70 factor (ECF subfamily) n=1 Tax=Amycolatopsis viridis TaxID=185678 RepID=A0ABX0SX72_9PSEU|nr:sigma-70 family RNA polymerase sigma factor [Amycolatopsis viridis]NIH81558.1 RNA polymerase sigma-70 factor (ECF subfamily) [Amycolatopsis viridis]